MQIDLDCLRFYPMKPSFGLFLLTFFLGVFQLKSQTFNTYLVLGANVTEASATKTGNSQVGTRIGLNAGAGVSAAIGGNWETGMELLYSQNGQYVNLEELSTVPLDKIVLHYVEVPLTIAYRIDLKKGKEDFFSSLAVGSGVSYARLVDFKVIAVNGTNLSNDVSFDPDRAFLFHFGATSVINPSFALNGKATLSMFGKWTMALRLLYCL